MSSEPAVSVRNVSKSYFLGKGARATTLAEQMTSKLRRLGKSEPREVLHALNGVSFEVEPGTAVGIVGRNGAGKSTLLKVLTRVTPPTDGEIVIRGRVGSLLEIGTGFHPELTGRENVYLNGSILGMRREEVDRSFDDIVDFADVAKFLDTPVKRYSSGMYVRLAFAVAAHLPTEIMLIDEVLAVGDAAFKSRSINKMKQIVHEGRTILFVQPSHAVGRGAVRPWDRARPRQRRVRRAHPAGREGVPRQPGVGGPPRRQGPSAALRHRRVPPRGLRAHQAGVLAGRGQGLPLRARPCHRLQPRRGHQRAHHRRVRDEIVQCDSRAMGVWMSGTSSAVGELILREPWLQPGRYTVHIVVHAHTVIDVALSVCAFEILPHYPFPVTVDRWATGGRVLGRFDWKAESKLDGGR